MKCAVPQVLTGSRLKNASTALATGGRNPKGSKGKLYTQLPKAVANPAQSTKGSPKNPPKDPPHRINNAPSVVVRCQTKVLPTIIIVAEMSKVGIKGKKAWGNATKVNPPLITPSTAEAFR